MAEWLSSASPAMVTLRVTIFFVGLTLASTAFGYAIERLGNPRRIWALPLDDGQLRHEAIGNVVFLAVTIPTFVAALSMHLAAFSEETLSRGVVTFVALWLGFQFYYYFLHRVMHDRRFVRYHRWHHVSRVTTPLSGQSMHVVEALFWMVGYVGIPVVFSRLVPISANGWASYIAYNVIGNIVGHANVEPVPRIPGRRFTSLFSNVFTYHCLHHARWTGNYGFGTTLMDRICHTEWSDWPELHERVASGQPLQSLKERGASFSRTGAL